MFTLNKVEKGDRIKLTKNGIVWTVWKKTNGNVINFMIALKSENGSFRVYTPKNTDWNREVWYV